jgi:hypothetical protein
VCGRIFVREFMREKTNLTLHPSVKKAALELAESQGRSLSELVERLLEREVERGRSELRDKSPESPKTASGSTAAARKERGLKKGKAAGGK